MGSALKTILVNTSNDPSVSPPTSDYTRLINFDTTVVLTEPETGRLEFQDPGMYQGSCTMRCHGQDHRDEDYQQQ